MTFPLPSSFSLRKPFVLNIFSKLRKQSERFKNKHTLGEFKFEEEIIQRVLNNLRIQAKKVNGIVNVKPSSSGTIEPKSIPIIVVNCQINHNVNPDPTR